jgi:hypothetical protein
VTDLLPLAGQLRELDSASLATLIEACGANSVSDMLDLAKLLLSRRELERRIRRLNFTELEDLRAGGSNSNWPEHFLGFEKPFPDAVELANQLTPIPLKQLVNNEHGPALAAYETLLAITELIFACERRLLTAVRSGLRMPDAKEIGETLKMEPARLQLRFQLALEAGLITTFGTRFAATQAGLAWLEQDNKTRWQWLAHPIWDLPQLSTAGRLAESVVDQYPLRDPNQIRLLRFSEILGITDQGIPTKQLSDKSGDWITAQLPKPEDSFLLQGDLSIVTMGPLAPAMHRQLDVVASAEDLGLASRFRLSPQSICHALESGMSVVAIRQFLETNSKGPIPQPVSYLLSDVEQKFGKLTVSASVQGALVFSEDQILLRQILTQASLRPLLFEIRGQALYSRLDQELVYFNLRSQGYLAVMVDEFGAVLSPRQEITQAEVVGIDYLALANRLISEEAKAPEGDDVMRQLQFALKNKMKVGLRVSYPDGSEKEHLIEPLGVAGGRVRGRDAVKQAEVTLPLSRVIAIWLA